MNTEEVKNRYGQFIMPTYCPSIVIEKAPSWEGKCYSAILASKSKK